MLTLTTSYIDCIQTVKYRGDIECTATVSVVIVAAETNTVTLVKLSHCINLGQKMITKIIKIPDTCVIYCHIPAHSLKYEPIEVQIS